MSLEGPARSVDGTHPGGMLCRMGKQSGFFDGGLGGDQAAGGGGGPAAAQFWRVVGQNASGASGLACSELRLGWGGSQHSLVGLTMTAIGTFTNGTFPLSKANDGTLETSNGTNLALGTSPTPSWDACVDLGSAQSVTDVYWAPQGNINVTFANTPTTLTLYSGPSTSGPWTQVATWTGYNSGDSGGNGTPGVPSANWNPGTFRQFNIGGTVTPP